MGGKAHGEDQDADYQRADVKTKAPHGTILQKIAAFSEFTIAKG
jgi:hypothetical protein